MAITATLEKFTGTSDTRSAPFYVRDDTGAELTEATAISFAQAAAVTAFGAVGTDWRYQRLSNSVARVHVLYKTGNLGPLTPPAAGSATYTFAFRAGAQRFRYSRQTITRVPNDAPDWKGQINPRRHVLVHGYEPLGLVVPAPVVTDRISYIFPTPVIGAAYRDAVRALFEAGGAVAANQFLNQPVGSMRLVECTSTVRSDGEQTIDFGFAYQANRVVTVGGLNLGTVRGHDLVWSNGRPKVINGIGGKETIISDVDAAYVEEVLPYIDFSVLGLPSV